MNKKHVVTTAVVVLVLAALIYFQVEHWRKFDWAKFSRTTGQVDMLHVVAAVALIYLTYLLRAVRWKVFLKPICNASWRKILGPTFIGFTGLALLGRPGEFIRPYLISRKEDTPFLAQIGVWTVERIFDIGAFTVLMTVTVFLPGAIQSNPYIHKFREAAIALCVLVAAAGAFCYAIRTRGPNVGAFLHRIAAPVSRKLAHHLDQKTRAFGAGLNTIHDRKSFLQLVAISLAIWAVIAFSYREICHAYPPEHGYRESKALGEIPGPPAVDVETATLAGMPEMAGQPLDEGVVEELRPSLERKGFKVERRPHLHGFWLINKAGHPLKRIGDRPHLTDMDLSHVLLLMGFSMVGSIVQLPAVGGGSQLAVISALQLIYGIPPETAVSCGIMLWVVTFMACIPVGLILAHREHVSLRKLSHEAQEEERIEESAAPSTP